MDPWGSIVFVFLPLLTFDKYFSLGTYCLPLKTPLPRTSHRTYFMQGSKQKSLKIILSKCLHFASTDGSGLPVFGMAPVGDVGFGGVSAVVGTMLISEPKKLDPACEVEIVAEARPLVVETLYGTPVVEYQNKPITADPVIISNSQEIELVYGTEEISIPPLEKTFIRTELGTCLKLGE